MATSRAATVEQYLRELPAERRATIARVRDVILKHLPAGYTESMSFGMIGYGVPLSRYPNTYNGQPLGYAALAAQKNYNSLYLLGAYADEKQRKRLEDAYAKAGRRLDMGKSCLIFRSADELPLDIIGELIASRSVDEFIALMEDGRRSTVDGKRSTATKAGARKAAKKGGAKKGGAKKSAAKKSGARKSAGRAQVRRGSRS